MKETTKRRVRGALIALVCFLLGGLVTLGVVWKVVGQDGRTLLQAYQLIRSEFVGEYDSQTHLETTLETMVDALGTGGPTTSPRRRRSRSRPTGKTPTWALASP